MEHTNTKSIPNWAKNLSALPPYMLYVRRAGAARRGGGRRGPRTGTESCSWPMAIAPGVALDRRTPSCSVINCVSPVATDPTPAHPHTGYMGGPAVRAAPKGDARSVSHVNYAEKLNCFFTAINGSKNLLLLVFI